MRSYQGNTFDCLPVEKLQFGILLDDLHDDALNSTCSFGGWQLRRAPNTLSPVIVAELLKLVAPLAHWPFTSHTHQVEVEGSGFRYTPLRDFNEWRVAVLEPGSSTAMSGARLSEALRVCDDDLCLELWQLKDTRMNGDGIGGSPLRCVHAAWGLGRSFRTPKVIRSQHVSEIVDLRHRLDEGAFPGIVRALQLFRDIDAISEGSDLKLLGYFSVLECLLSHSPQPNDSYDTVTRQLRRNITLLDNRLRLHGSNFGLHTFQKQKRDKVISQLYALRSAIAHGGDSQAPRKWLDDNRPLDAPLNGDWLPGFVRTVAQKALQCALREPQLISDLKG